MNTLHITAIILAAGKGTRMKSERAKVLHELFFKPMLHHVLDTVTVADIEQIAVITGHQGEEVLASLDEYSFTPVIQEEQLGTGHAVLCAQEACAASDLIMILCGDTPLIRPQTLQAMITQHRENRDSLTLMTTHLANPFGYGRIISDRDGQILEIVEEKDADPEQRKINEINGGIYLVDRKFLFQALDQVGTDNSQGEVYLTDIVKIAKKDSHSVQTYLHSPAIDILGVNSRVELALAHAELQMRHNREIMLSGVTMYGPETILLSPQSSIDRDSTIEANVQITGSSKIGTNVRVCSGAVIHNCRIGNQAIIGANAVLRNTVIGAETTVAPLTFQIK